VIGTIVVSLPGVEFGDFESLHHSAWSLSQFCPFLLSDFGGRRVDSDSLPYPPTLVDIVDTRLVDIPTEERVFELTRLLRDFGKGRHPVWTQFLSVEFHFSAIHLSTFEFAGLDSETKETEANYQLQVNWHLVFSLGICGSKGHFLFSAGYFRRPEN